MAGGIFSKVTGPRESWMTAELLICPDVILRVHFRVHFTIKELSRISFAHNKLTDVQLDPVEPISKMKESKIWVTIVGV